jgi:hypothetical protein
MVERLQRIQRKKYTIKQPRLIDKMTPGDLVEVLRRLPLPRLNSTCALTIDQGVRDYIVAAIAPNSRHSK